MGTDKSLNLYLNLSDFYEPGESGCVIPIFLANYICKIADFAFGQATNFCKVVDFALGQAKNFCTVAEIPLGRQSNKKKRSYRDCFYNYAFLTISNQSVSE